MEKTYQEYPDILPESLRTELFKNIYVGVVIFAKLKVLFINNWMCAKLGYQRNEILEMTDITSIVYKDHLEMIKDYHIRRFSGDLSVPVKYEVALIRKNGGLLWLNCRVEMFENEGEKYLVQMCSDITRRKNIEDNFHNIFELSPDAISISNIITGKIIQINQAFTDITGYTKDDIKDISIDDIFLEQDKKNFILELEENDIVRSRGIVLKHKDGTEIHTSISSKKIDVDNGTCILTITRDITELIKQECELKETLEKNTMLYSSLATLLDNTSYIICVKDLSLNILFTNKTLENYFNGDRNRLHQLLNDHQIVKNDYNVIKSGKEAIFTEEFFINGTKYIFRSFKTPIFDYNNKVIGVATMATEIYDTSILEKHVEKFVHSVTEKQKIISGILHSITSTCTSYTKEISSHGR